MSNELNAYLKEKGVSNDIRNKRMLATAFGLVFDASTPEQENALLLALKVGGMASGKMKQSFIVEIAFDDETQPASYNTIEEASKDAAFLQSQGKHTRITNLVTISKPI